MENTKLIRLEEVIERTGLGRSSLYAMSKKGEFPKQIKIGPRRSAWIENEIQEWIHTKIVESRS